MKTILVCSLCLVAIATSASAEGVRDAGHEDYGPDRERGAKHRRPPHDGGEMFKRMDADGNGTISREEFLGSPRLARLPEEKRGRIFMRLDGNGDGSLSREEIDEIRKKGEGRAREFRELDADSSGGLSFLEFSGGRFLKRLPEAKRREIFKRLDTDGNGEISPEDRPEKRRRPERFKKN